MTKLDEARADMIDYSGLRFTHLLEILIDAKLSPALVGEDEGYPAMAARVIREADATTLNRLTRLARLAPTPPAEGSEGELERWNYDRTAGVLSPNPHGYWTNWRIATDRIADLEARLAEAKSASADMQRANVELFCKNESAKSALADATKRIEALEAGLVDADRDRTYWHRKWRALSPASEGKP